MNGPLEVFLKIGHYITDPKTFKTFVLICHNSGRASHYLQKLMKYRFTRIYVYIEYKITTRYQWAFDRVLQDYEHIWTVSDHKLPKIKNKINAFSALRIDIMNAKPMCSCGNCRTYKIENRKNTISNIFLKFAK